jgi:DNA-binding transcriptional regulator YiaG
MAKTPTTKSPLTAQDMRRLRESTGLSPREWSLLLDCHEATVWNIENGQPVGRQMGLLAILMAHPDVRERLPEIRAHAEKILKKGAELP